MRKPNVNKKLILMNEGAQLERKVIKDLIVLSMNDRVKAIQVILEYITLRDASNP